MEQAEKLALGTHLYAKLRRTHNRIIDVVWMFQNPAYAQEVLRLARSANDPEAQRLADRLAAMIEGRPAPSPAPARVSPQAVPAIAEPEPEAELEGKHHYIGALR